MEVAGRGRQTEFTTVLVICILVIWWKTDRHVVTHTHTHRHTGESPHTQTDT
jgi:hypothetical protein